MMRSNRAMDQAIAIIVALLLSSQGAVAADRVELTQAERPQTESKPAQACVIKGNVAASGERIYHVPGGEYYAVTRVSPAKGERWFCSEAEAVAAGWRRSKR